MSQYAKTTDVPTNVTRSEIERTLTRYGASEFGYVTSGNIIAIMFTIKYLTVKMVLPLPDEDSVKLTETGRRRSVASYKQYYDQLLRQRWRALALVIKAKLEAVECNISTLEREFLADTMTPNGEIVYQVIKPQLESMQTTHEQPRLLLSAK
jgi:hypothetical protein